MIPVCISRCENCTPMECVIRPCGEENLLNLGNRNTGDDYDVYLTNLITNITRKYVISEDISGNLILDLQDVGTFINGQLFRIAVTVEGGTDLVDIETVSGVIYTCATIPFANLYDNIGLKECPAIQELTPQ